MHKLNSRDFTYRNQLKKHPRGKFYLKNYKKVFRVRFSILFFFLITIQLSTATKL